MPKPSPVSEFCSYQSRQLGWPKPIRITVILEQRRALVVLCVLLHVDCNVVVVHDSHTGNQGGQGCSEQAHLCWVLLAAGIGCWRIGFLLRWVWLLRTWCHDEGHGWPIVTCEQGGIESVSPCPPRRALARDEVETVPLEGSVYIGGTAWNEGQVLVKVTLEKSRES